MTVVVVVLPLGDSRLWFWEDWLSMYQLVFVNELYDKYIYKERGRQGGRPTHGLGECGV